jgi:hypothetical protein
MFRNMKLYCSPIKDPANAQQQLSIIILEKKEVQIVTITIDLSVLAHKRV